ncbi:MAG: hypothetical protein HGN29_07805 [Asgard group archaeon]|nr:hypothetical protein [Asgard group archaeon]
MEVFRTGKYHISDLDNLQELQPLEYANRTVLKRLNYLIGFIKKEKPEILQNFVTKLNLKLVKLLNKPYVNEGDDEEKIVSKDFIHLKVFPELLYNCLNYYLQLLNIDTSMNWSEDKIKIPNRNYIQSFLYHRYYNALVLTEILERNLAVQIFKDYIDSYVKSQSTDWRKYENLEEFREARIPKKDDPPNIGWIIVQGIIENGKYPQKKITCMWADAITDLPDTELKYLAACYGDFQGYNNNNENFVLTMSHTIVEGYPYCDCIVHDIRVNKDLTHPPKEFFDNIWQLKED